MSVLTTLTLADLSAWLARLQASAMPPAGQPRRGGAER